MMPPTPNSPLGVSFSPTPSNMPSLNTTGPAAGGQGGGDPNAANTPFQTAIRTLSLRLPRVIGAGSLSPGALMGAPGLTGASPQIQALLKMLFGDVHLGGGLGAAPVSSPGGSNTFQEQGPYGAMVPPSGGAISQPTTAPSFSYPAPNITPGGLPGGMSSAPLAPTAPQPMPVTDPGQIGTPWNPQNFKNGSLQPDF